MTNEFFIFNGFVLLALMLGVAVLWSRLKEAEHRIKRMDERVSDHWRTHKDDHYENARKHDRLVEALDLVEAPTVQKRYVKKGNV